MKKKEAISLIVLVITIIVMAILATTIIITLSNTNVIKSAEEAVKNANKATEKEALNTVLAQAYLVGSGNFTKDDFETALNNTLGSGNATVVDNNNNSYTVTMTGLSGGVYTIEPDRTITEGAYDKWNGTDKETPQITGNKISMNKAAHMKWLADEVAAGNLYEGYTIYLEGNLDFGAVPTDGNWETQANESVKWISIGKDEEHTLKATFDGNNHTIKGVYVNDETDFNGVFGMADTVQNLKIRDSYIAGGTKTGGIVGVLVCGSLDNCHNINTTVVLKEGEHHTVGGVVGKVSSGSEAIKNCTNGGEVIAKSQSTKEYKQVGGIAGTVFEGVIITKCSNIGDVTSVGNHTGGVIGYTASSTTNCYNTGNVTSTGANTGGIIGYTVSSTTNCYNIGNVTSTGTNTGGIVGYTVSSTTNCYNIGNIDGNNYVGGVVGLSGSSTTNCYNTGDVTGTGTNVGGILGTCTRKTTTVTTYCYNTGTVKEPEEVGGICGYVGAQDYTGSVAYSYNKGKIVYTGTGTDYGAVAGKMASDATAKKCFFLSTNGIDIGIGAINAGGDLETQRKEATATTEDIKSFEEFIAWIKTK